MSVSATFGAAVSLAAKVPVTTFVAVDEEVGVGVVTPGVIDRTDVGLGGTGVRLGVTGVLLGEAGGRLEAVGVTLDFVAVTVGVRLAVAEKRTVGVRLGVTCADDVEVGGVG